MLNKRKAATRFQVVGYRYEPIERGSERYVANKTYMCSRCFWHVNIIGELPFKCCPNCGREIVIEATDWKKSDHDN